MSNKILDLGKFKRRLVEKAIARKRGNSGPVRVTFAFESDLLEELDQCIEFLDCSSREGVIGMAITILHMWRHSGSGWRLALVKQKAFGKDMRYITKTKDQSS